MGDMATKFDVDLPNIREVSEWKQFQRDRETDGETHQQTDRLVKTIKKKLH